MVADAMWLALVVALVVGTCATDRETGMLWNSFDGSIYQGEYIRGYMFGTRDGKGAQRWYRSGNGYEGDFVGNMKHGYLHSRLLIIRLLIHLLLFTYSLRAWY